MSWNHRVVRKTLQNGTKYLGIHEVYYDSDGNIFICTTNPVSIRGENIEDLQQTLNWMQEAVGQPIVDIEDL